MRIARKRKTREWEKSMLRVQVLGSLSKDCCKNSEKISSVNLSPRELKVCSCESYSYYFTNRLTQFWILKNLFFEMRHLHLSYNNWENWEVCVFIAALVKTLCGSLFYLWVYYQSSLFDWILGSGLGTWYLSPSMGAKKILKCSSSFPVIKKKKKNLFDCSRLMANPTPASFKSLRKVMFFLVHVLRLKVVFNLLEWIGKWNWNFE